MLLQKTKYNFYDKVNDTSNVVLTQPESTTRLPCTKLSPILRLNSTFHLHQAMTTAQCSSVPKYALFNTFQMQYVYASTITRFTVFQFYAINIFRDTHELCAVPLFRKNVLYVKKEEEKSCTNKGN